GYGDLREPEPAHHTAHKAVALGHRKQGFDHSPIHQAKIAHVERDAGVRQEVKNSIKRLSRPELESRLPFALSSGAIDDVVTFLPPLHELADNLGRVLEVSVDDYDSRARRVGQPGGDGDLVTKISGKADHADANVLSVKFSQQIRRGVGAPVIDVNNLEVQRHGLEKGHQAAIRLAQHFL